MLVTIRHGETNFNVKRLYSGVNDLPLLTENAKLEAFKKGELLKQYNFDVAYISPLTRAFETYNELNKSLNIPYIKDQNLVERDFKAYEGKVYEAIDYSIIWNVELSKSIDIETIDDLTIRVEKVLNRIKEESPNKNVLIVAHSGVCRVIRYILEGKKENDLRNYKMENLHIDVYKEW